MPRNALAIHRFLLVFLCVAFAPAREPAHAQFSFPYDPDFERQKEREPAEPAPAPAEEPPPLPQDATPRERPLSPGPARDLKPPHPAHRGRFLLLDRPDPSRFFEPERAREPKDIAKFLEELRPLRVDAERWNKTRSDLESGILPQEEIDTPVLPLPVSELLISSETPQTPPPEVEIPGYGTSLSVTGRKIVGFQFSEKRFLNDQKATARPKTANLIDITQQLQLRMQGKVGPKITVNVDFDDTKTNKQDISVVYTGDPNEVVQNASFGDIDLSLPSSEFVSYNKQLFGIRADLKYKGFKGNFIGSRTKGTTKTKQFIGNTQFNSIDIPDNTYVRRQYYDLTFGNAARLPLQNGTERVFLAQQNPQAVNTNSINLTVDDLAVPSSSFTGSFLLLSPGQDYTIDYVNGILTFRIPMQPQFVAAVNFVDASGTQLANQTSASTTGGTGLNKLVKTSADVPIRQSSTTTQELGFNRELKTVYSLGTTQIVRDDGRGNFVLKVIDPHTRDEIGSGLNPPQKYPDHILVDFENGSFRLLQPFGTGVSSPTPDPNLYSPTPISKQLFHAEYHFRLRTFFLEPNLVFQSEVVLIDGVRLNRNVDYFIDYESGFITFFNEQRIQPRSVIDISYEVAPFSGVTSESILGTRVSHDFNKHWSLGSTVLYQAGTKSPVVPNVTDLAKNLLILEADSQLKDVRLLPGLKGTFQGEFARSLLQPNLSGNALIDNMEGSKQEDQAGLLSAFWQIAANPTQGPADPQSQTLVNEDVRVLDINPGAQANSNDTQKTLNLGYNFTVDGTTETSFVYVFSPTGVDMSQKSILEVTMLGDASNNEINFTLGGVNEDADSTGGVTLACSNGQTLLNAPKTEDVNCDSALQPGEDIGWLYGPAGKNSARIGASNGRIDAADLNRNGRLDSQDLTGDSFGYAATAGTGHDKLFDITSGSTRTRIDFGGASWHTFQIPLDLSTATLSRWNAVKQLRVSVRQGAGGAVTGTLKFARLAVVGNSWRQGQAGDPKDSSGPKGAEALTVAAVNNADNPNYVPIYNAGGQAQAAFHDLYGSLGELQRQSNSKNVQEQALQLSWADLATGATVFTRRVFTRPIDVSQHRNFNFLLFGNADPNNPDVSGNQVFFLRVGSDQSYFEMDVPLNFTGWRRFTAKQVDINGDQIPDAWAVGDATPRTVAFSTGTPNLQQISNITAGVYASSGAAPARGSLWLNELYVSDPIYRMGTAQKVQMDFDVSGWSTFGYKYRSVDRNYQTPTTVVSNQDSRQDTAYLNFTRLQFFPMSFTLARSVTDTPNPNATGNLSNIVNLLQGGRVTAWNGTANGNLAYGAYPRLSLGYIRARTEYHLLTRLDDRDTYNSALNYSVPLNTRFAPKTVDLAYSYNKHSVSFASLRSRLIPGNVNTDEFSHTYGTRLSFAPWTGASFNPNLSMTVVRERRSELLSGGAAESNREYPKSMNETAGFSANFRLLPWLNPSVNYSATNIENNLLNVSTFIVSGSTLVFNLGDIKTVNRSANGGVSLPLNVVEIYPRARLLRSFSLANSYQAQDGDVWNNVEKELDTRLALWVRSPLRPGSRASQRANLTLRDTLSSTQRWSPLDAYDLPGRKSALRTLALTNNYLKSIQRTETTGTRSKTVSTTLPDIIASLSQVEKLLWAERWLSNGQINLKYAAHTTEAVGLTLDSDDSLGLDLRTILNKRLDIALSGNLRNSEKRDLRAKAVTQNTHHKDATGQTTFDVRQFRFTPKVDYSLDVSKQGTGVETQHLSVITPSILSRADLAMPRGLLLPFTSKPILFTNRVIWTSTLSMALRASPVAQSDNSRLLNFGTSGDYEIAKNLRMTLNGAFSRLWHKFLKEEDYISYQFGTTLTFQF